MLLTKNESPDCEFLSLRPRSVLSQRPPLTEVGLHLDNYLSDLSKMPAKKEPTKAIKSPVINPPTPFRNTPRTDPSSTTVLRRDDGPDDQKLSKIIYESEDESSSSSDDPSPQSVISPMTAPSYPSVMSTEPATTEVPIVNTASAAAVPMDHIAEPLPATDQRPTPEKRKNPFVGVSGTELMEDPDNLRAAPALDQNHPTSSRINVEHDTSVASSLQDSVSIKMFEAIEVRVSAPPNKSEEATRLEAAVSSLAMRQETEIRRLLEQQEREREELRRMFERQRKELVDEISAQIRISQQSRLNDFFFDANGSRCPEMTEFFAPPEKS